MPWRRLGELRRKLRAQAALDPRGAAYYRLAVTVALVFLVAALSAIGRIVWALEHRVVWVNYRGSVLSHAQMYVALALSSVVALGSIAIILVLRKSAPTRRR
jgi:hypothetical protein